MATNDKQYEELRKKLENQDNLIKILTKLAPQAKLAQMLSDGKDLGRNVKVSVYNGELVIGWKTLKNVVRQSGEKVGDFDVEQKMLVITEPVGGNADKVKEIEEKLAASKAKDHYPTISKYEKMLAELESSKKEYEMSYLEFSLTAFEKRSVEVKGTKETKEGTFIIFDWVDSEGEPVEKELDIRFIN